LAHLLVRKDEAVSCQLQKCNYNGNTHENDGKTLSDFLLANFGDEDADGGRRDRSKAFLDTMRLHLYFDEYLMRLDFLLKGNEVIFEVRKQFLEYKPILMFNDLSNSLGSE
jgi:hypothetical protein